jgi:hypothetical protein
MEGVENFFNPSTSYQVLNSVEVKIEIMVAQATNFFKNGSPNENTQQSTKT